MKTVQISGVSGQLGAHMAEFLLDKGGYKIHGFSRRCASHSTERIDHLFSRDGFTYEEGDITDEGYINSIINLKPDWFLNFAAQSHVATSFKNVSSTFQIDTMGVVNLLEAIRLLSPKTSLYQCSTSELFGSSFTEKDGRKYQDENTPFVCQSPYSISKLASHEMVKLYRRAYGLNCRAGIMFNFEGKKRGHAFATKKICLWIRDFKNWLSNQDKSLKDITFRNEDLYIEENSSSFKKLRLGNLEAKRDWNFVGDTCQAIYLIMNSDPDEYVIGSGETHSIREFLELSFNMSGIDDDYNKYVFIDQEFIRPAEVDYLCSKPDKIKSKLGWEPKLSFEDLVREMLEV